MKKIGLFVSIFIGIALLLSGCNANKTAKATAGESAAVTLTNNKMDRQKKELEQIKHAQVESINAGQAIKITFDSGSLFATNSSSLNPESQSVLTQLAHSLKNHLDTDVHIYGHTDSTGSDKINIPLSKERAGSIENFLMRQGIMKARMTAEGLGSSQPVADNTTLIGKQKNLRVEIYIVPHILK
jgi:outer membrane protein OmpA-like peptidoglycan-associated protein